MNDNKPGWGNAPQASDTGRPGWGGAPQASDTGRPGWGGAPQASDTGKPGWGGAPQASDTGKPAWGGAPQASNTGNVNPGGNGEVPEYPEFKIEGVSYRMIRVISSHSGEAKIFEIEQGGTHFALKLYRPGIKPNHDVLAKVKNLRGNGMLIDIYAHGVWKDENNGTLHDYEIMEYCAGGSLADLKSAKDEKVMKEYAARMAAALDFAHSNGILHRDVKPANFLFTDESRTRFVLTDWGLAKTLDSKGRAVTDAGRTKIYAAPEMYTYIPGKPTYVNAKADFFSMGMTLLALWMGEGLLLADETQLVKDKQEETLPYPGKGEMSNHLLSLIKGLTRRNPDVRAGFDDVVRWAKGETIYSEAIKDFRIVFSAEDNLVAHNATELGTMMWEHRELAKKYLYGPGKILMKLLKEVDQTALAAIIEDIVELKFPGNQDAGLFAACLALNSDTIYEGIDGKPLATQKEIAHELYDNSEAYRKALYNKKEHPFFAYLSAKGLDDRIPEFRRMIRNSGVAGVRAIAYMLDPDLPYKFNTSSLNFLLTCEHPEVNSLEELREWLADESVSPYLSFYEVDFLTWLANREPELAGKAKLIAENKDYDFNYKCDLILYTILP
ncbi:MAG: protein kinase, partial [Muribaculaceae bacterium]|nr:protein kinase [Muribaculaceae bacterium]